uniref:Uncharacterized protein n=1 Tax=Anopheles coluzzii TaxID=1518534 RepID=A0A8W7PAQ7_ANOCL
MEEKLQTVLWNGTVGQADENGETGDKSCSIIYQLPIGFLFTRVTEETDRGFEVVLAGISCFEDGSLWDEQPEALFTFATGMKQYGSGARSAAAYMPSGLPFGPFKAVPLQTARIVSRARVL